MFPTEAGRSTYLLSLQPPHVHGYGCKGHTQRLGHGREDG